MSNQNYLIPTQFMVTIKKLPTTTFFCQNISLPSLTLPTVINPNPLVAIPEPGDQLQFGEFEMSFLIDEDMVAYLEIYNWMVGLGYPQAYSQYADILGTPYDLNKGRYSDISVEVLTSSKNPNKRFTLVDAFPTSLSAVNFETTVEDPQPITATATFAYTFFKPTT